MSGYNWNMYCWKCDSDGQKADHESSQCARAAPWAVTIKTTTGETEGSSGDRPVALDAMATESTSNVASNTIVTTDVGQTEVTMVPILDDGELVDASNSEKKYPFDAIMDRWVPMESFEVKSSQVEGEIIRQYEVPSSFYTADACVANMLPFQQFIYGRFNAKILFKINATKFQQGKLVISVLPDPNNLWDHAEDYYSVQSAYLRNGIIVDINSQTEFVLDVDYAYHRSYVRVHKTSSENVGIKAGVFSKVIVQVLSPLVAATGQSLSCYVVPMFKLYDSHFTGMSFAKSQGISSTLDFAQSTIQDVQNVISTTRRLVQLDKPLSMQMPTCVVPTPRANWGAVKGMSDAVAMRMDPRTSTYMPLEITKAIQLNTIKQLVRQWSYCSKFSWKSDVKVGQSLMSLVADPSCIRPPEATVPSNMTMLEYCSSMFQLNRGTIEFCFRFVCTDFHRGSVLISCEFGRVTKKDDLCSKSSTYTKTFDLGEQKEVEFVVPYIYDTPYRRSTCLPMYSESYVRSDASRSALQMWNNTRINVTVLNQLRPIGQVSDQVQCLVFVRAGTDFDLRGPVSFSGSYSNWRLTEQLNNFPYGYTFEGKLKGNVLHAKENISSIDYKLKIPIELNPNFSATTVKDWLTLGLLKKEGSVNKPQDVMQAESQGPVVPLDTTDNFERPNRKVEIISNEYCMNIWELLRRPLLICGNILLTGAKVTGDSMPTLFYLPLMPPQMGMVQTVSSIPAVLNNGILQSSHVALTNLFRFWRGTMRYSILFYSNSPKPIYLYVMPQSGVRIIGNQKWPLDPTGDSTVNNFNPGTCSLTSLVVVPRINPTVTIEVPYESYTPWSLLHNGKTTEGLNSNFAWRDKGDENVGHLVIVAQDPVECDIWWAAGDDFRMAGFLGIPEVKNNTMVVARTDKHPDVAAQGLVEYTKNIEIPLVVQKFWKPAALGAAAVVGGSVASVAAGLGAAHTIYKVDSALDQALPTVSGCVDSAKKLLDNLDGMLPQNLFKNTCKSITEAIKSTWEWIKTLFDNEFLVGIKDKIVGLLYGFYDTYVQQDYLGVCDVLGSIFGVLLDFKDGALIRIKKALGYLVKKFWWKEPEVNQETEEAEAQEFCLTDFSVIAGLIISAFAGHYNMKMVSPDVTIIKKISGIFSNASTWSIFSNATRCFGAMFKLMGSLTEYFFSAQSDEITFAKLLDDNPEFLKNFVKRAQDFLMEVNYARYRRDNSKKIELWNVVCNAHQLLGIAASGKTKLNPALLTICKAVVKKANDQAIVFMNCPVRYEPFVICIEGGAGVGKSFLASELAVDMLKSLGFSEMVSELIYVKNPGVQFWNGYRDQPIIIFDDFLNINHPDAAIQQLSDLYSLKSSSVFNPNMAHLETKELRANPLIIVLLMNNAFPVLDVVSCKEAVLRRRDVLLRASRTPEFVNKKMTKIPVSVREDRSYIQFQFFSDPTTFKSLEKTFYNYDQMKVKVQEQLLEYHTLEVENVKNRIEKINTAFPQCAVQNWNVMDPFSLFYQTIASVNYEVNVNLVPSEQLSELIKKLEDQGFATPPESQSDECFSTRLKHEVMDSPLFQECVGCKIIKPILFACSSITNPGVSVHGACPTCYYHNLNKKCNCGCGDLWAIYTPGVIGDCVPSLLHKILCQAGDRNLTKVEILCAQMASMDKLLETFDSLTTVCGVSRRDYERFKALHKENIGSYEQLIKLLKRKTYLIRSSKELEVEVEQLKQKTEELEVEIARNGPLLRRYQSVMEKVSAKILDLSQNGCTVEECENIQELFSDLQLVDLPDIPVTIVIHVRKKTISDQFMAAVDSLRRGYYRFVKLVSSVTPEMWTTICQFNKEQWMGLGFVASSVMLFMYALVSGYHGDWVDMILCFRGVVPFALFGAVYWFAGKEKQEHAAQEPNSQEGTRYRSKFREVCNHHLFVPELSYYENDCFHMLLLDGTETVEIQDYFCSPLCVWNPSNSDEINIVREKIDEWLKCPDNAQCYRLYLEGKREECHIPFLLRRSLARPDFLLSETIIMQAEQHVSWWDILCTKYQQYRETLIKILKIAGIAITAILACRYIFGGSITAQHNTDSNRITSGQAARFLRAPRIMSREDITAQDMNSVESISQTLVKNLGQFMHLNEHGMRCWFNFVGIANRYALIPYHFLKTMETLDSELQVRMLHTPHVMHKLKFEDIEQVAMVATDVMLIKVIPQIPLFKDIVRFFPPESMYDTMQLSASAVLYELPIAGVQPTIGMKEVILLEFVKKCNVRSPTAGNYEIKNLYKYNYSRPGACGSLLLTPSYQNYPILGVHLAGLGVGTAGCGFAVAVTQEDLIPLLKERVKELKLPKVQKIVGKVIPVGECDKLSVLGMVEAQQSVFIPSKSKITSSLVSHFLEAPTTHPAILHSKDPRFNHEWKSPLLAGVLKHGNIPGTMSQKVLEDVEDMLTADLLRFKCSQLDPKPLTYFETVAGIENAEYYDSMDLSTSVGWPWSNKYRGGKKDVMRLDEERKRLFMMPDLKQELEEQEKLRKKGIGCAVVFTDLLKDERRKAEKTLKEGGTRVFCASPVDATIAQRKYMLHFFASIMQNKIQNGIAIGVNPDGPDWVRLYNYLMEIQDGFWVTMDYKDFGPAFSAQAYEVARHVVLKWFEEHTSYDEEQLTVVDCLMQEQMNSYHIVKNVIYQQFGGSPSGAAWTTIINSLVNKVYIYYAWMLLVGESYDSFSRQIRMVVYGDDLIMRVSNNLRGKFNQKQIIQRLCDEGIPCTPGNKGLNINEETLSSDVEFLKRKFIPHPSRGGMMLAPLPAFVIEDCAKFMHTQEDAFLGTIENVRASLTLAYGQGREYFKEWKYKLITACAKANVEMVFPDWDELDKLHFDGTGSVADLFPYFFRKK